MCMCCDTGHSLVFLVGIVISTFFILAVGQMILYDRKLYFLDPTGCGSMCIGMYQVIRVQADSIFQSTN